MYFAIIAEDVEDSQALRKQTRAEHLARLQALTDEGRLLLAGPHPAIASDAPTDAGFTGSLIVAAFESEASAKKWANEDPYRTAGIYKTITVKPFIPVLP